MRPTELKNEFKSGKIEKKVYWTLMREHTAALTDMRDLLISNNDVKEIVINRDGITLENSDGIKMYFDFSQTICRAEVSLIMDGDPEQDDFDLINDVLTDGELLDIGANAGLFALAINKKNPRVRVHSFEPIEETFNLMLKNLKLNNIGMDAIIPNNAGLSDKSGTAVFYLPGQSEAASLKPITDEYYLQESDDTGRRTGHNSERKIECKLSTVDEYCQEKGLKSVDFIKIDVEGNEINVLKGAGEVLSKYQPVVYSELLRKHAKRFDYHPDDVIALMKGYGYSCFTLRDRKLVKIETIDNVEETNFFFLSTEKHIDIINKYANRSN